MLSHPTTNLNVPDTVVWLSSVDSPSLLAYLFLLFPTGGDAFRFSRIKNCSYSMFPHQVLIKYVKKGCSTIFFMKNIHYTKYDGIPNNYKNVCQKDTSKEEILGQQLWWKLAKDVMEMKRILQTTNNDNIYKILQSKSRIVVLENSRRCQQMTKLLVIN